MELKIKFEINNLLENINCTKDFNLVQLINYGNVLNKFESGIIQNLFFQNILIQ